MMPNGNCPIGAAHAQQIRLLEESLGRLEGCLALKADAARIERLEEQVEKMINMFWALIMLVIANLIGIILMLLKERV